MSDTTTGASALPTHMTLEQIQAMPSHERLHYVNELRMKALRGEPLTDEEIHFGLRLVRVERISRHQSPRARSKEPAPAYDLSDF